jgi:hypothetical protein
VNKKAFFARRKGQKFINNHHPSPITTTVPITRSLFGVMLRLITLFLAASTASGFAPSLSNKAAIRTTTRSERHRSFSSIRTSSILHAVKQPMLQETELRKELYLKKEKETPKILGGLKIGLRKLVVITGASSGLGLNTAVTLAKTGRYFVVMACRDVEKAKKGT